MRGCGCGWEEARGGAWRPLLYLALVTSTSITCFHPSLALERNSQPDHAGGHGVPLFVTDSRVMVGLYVAQTVRRCTLCVASTSRRPSGDGWVHLDADDVKDCDGATPGGRRRGRAGDRRSNGGGGGGEARGGSGSFRGAWLETAGRNRASREVKLGRPKGLNTTKQLINKHGKEEVRPAPCTLHPAPYTQTPNTVTMKLKPYISNPEL